MNLAEVPDGLAPMQYAQRICEDLGIPARSNVPIIGEAIEAVAKSRLFRGREDATKVAFYWLHRRVMTAREQGTKINSLWFHGGEYWNVERGDRAPERPIRYEHHGQGYGMNDMKHLYAQFEKRVARKQAINVDELLDELDQWRGESPLWRRR